MSDNKGFSTVTDTTTDLNHLFDTMNAGVFKQKVEAYLNAAAAAVVNSHKKSKGVVNVSFEITPVGDSTQVMITHTVKAKIPLPRGEKTESDATETAYHVGRGGKVTFDAPKENAHGQGQFGLNQEIDGRPKPTSGLA